MTQPGVDPRQDIGTQGVTQGDPLNWTVTIQKTASNGTVSAVDLTTFGASWSANLRTSTAMVPGISFTIDATNAATGILVLSLPAATTANMATGSGDVTTWHFDLQVTGGTVSPFTPYKGSIQVWKVYTHA